MLLSIIIPVYNVEAFVEKCIRSCESQDIPHSEYEIICVNDGSKDRSLSIIKRLSREFTNIIIIDQPNGGLSAARNSGMKKATGDYYMFVDSDDWIAENCLGLLTKKLLKEKPDVLALCAANVYGTECKRRFSYINEVPQKGKDFLKNLRSPCAPFSIWSSVFLSKNDLFFYEGIFHEDSEFTPRAYYLADKVSFTNDIVYYVYQNPNSITRSVNPKKSFDLIEYVCEHLSVFSNMVDNDYKYIFHDMISMYINNSLANISSLDPSEKDSFNLCLYNHKKLFKHLKQSTLVKYKVEYMLFNLFPKNYISVYQFIKKLH